MNQASENDTNGTLEPTITYGACACCQVSGVNLLASETDGEDKKFCCQCMIGKKVRVFWPLTQQWYSGTVHEYNSSSGEHRLVYPDGDIEWVKIGDSSGNEASSLNFTKDGVNHISITTTINDNNLTNNKNLLIGSKIKEFHTNEADIKSDSTENKITTHNDAGSPSHSDGRVFFSPQRHLSMQHVLTSHNLQSHPTPKHEQNKDKSCINITNKTAISNEYNSLPRHPLNDRQFNYANYPSSACQSLVIPDHQPPHNYAPPSHIHPESGPHHHPYRKYSQEHAPPTVPYGYTFPPLHPLVHSAIPFSNSQSHPNFILNGSGFHTNSPDKTQTSSSSGTKRKAGPKCWSKEEDALLLNMVQTMTMPMKWSVVAQSMPERTGKQCRERYVNHLNPRLKSCDWSPLEDATIFHLYNTIGSQWAKMSKVIPGRTDNGIKNRFHNLRRQLEREDEHRIRLSKPEDFPDEVRLDRLRPFPRHLRGKNNELWDMNNAIGVLAAQSVLGGSFSRNAARFGPFHEADPSGEQCARCGLFAPSVHTGTEICSKTKWCQTCTRIPPHMCSNILRECMNLRRCKDDEKLKIIEQWDCDILQNAKNMT